jgi:hypothetical protein
LAIPVLILGESGSGKSTSLRSFDPTKVSIINVAGKPLPFKSAGFKTVKTDNYPTITGLLKKTASKTIVVDDSQFLLVNEFMRSVNEKGYDKFNQLASNFWNLIQFVINDLPDDRIVYFLHHIQRDDLGREKAKTIGRMLDEKVTVEGMFTIVLKTSVHDGGYYFATRTNGADTVKSPIGMFEADEIDNDLKLVDDTIRSYYGLDK